MCRVQGSHTDQHAPEPFFIPFPRCSFLLSFPFLPFPCSSFALDPCRPPRQHIRNRAAAPPPPTTSPPFRHPQQPPTRDPTATRSTDEQQHTTATPSTASGMPMGAPSSPAGTPRALNCAPMVPAGHPRPPGCASEYIYKFRLTFTIPMGISAGGRVASDENIQNINLL